MKKLYTVLSNVFIDSLNINGPVTTPTMIEESEILSMVKKGATVYIHNPAYPKEKYQVTKDNYRVIVFKKTRKQAAIEKAQGLNTTTVEVVRKEHRKHEKQKEKDSVVVIPSPDKSKDEPKDATASIKPDDFTQV